MALIQFKIRINILTWNQKFCFLIFGGKQNEKFFSWARTNNSVIVVFHTWNNVFDGKRTRTKSEKGKEREGLSKKRTFVNIAKFVSACERVSVWLSEWVSEWERENIVYVCVCERDGESCVCVCVWLKQWVCFIVREGNNVYECICLILYEREREREGGEIVYVNMNVTERKREWLHMVEYISTSIAYLHESILPPLNTFSIFVSNIGSDSQVPAALIQKELDIPLFEKL